MSETPHYTTRRRVEFSHCDPAGIVFYPRYFELLNSVVEEWFDRAVGWSYADMHLRDHLGVPAVHIDIDFIAPSPLGDDLDFSLTIARLGATSLKFEVLVACADEPRLRANLVVVQMHLHERHAVPWAPAIRERIEALKIQTRK